MEDLKEMDAFLHVYDLPKLKQEDINNLYSSIRSNEIKAIM
jgi:hypothetical protein